MPNQVFTSSGTFTVPSSAQSVKVEAWGPGGNGGASDGGGGGGGEYAAEPALGGITPGSTVLTVTITAGAATTVTGGSVTVTANAGHNGANGAGAGGAGGSGSTNTTHFSGGAGANGLALNTGGGGGASGSASGAGAAGSSGTGGTGVNGGGSGGNGTGGSGVNGSPGTAPGGGGGGGGNPGGTGGAGAGGQVIITWTIANSGKPPIPPRPFTPMSFRHWQPPTGPSQVFAGKVAMAPLSGSGSQAPPVFTGTPAMAPLAVSGQFSSQFPFPRTPLGIKVELLINGTWTDITSFVLNRADIVIARGRPDESQQVTPSVMTLQLANRDGRFSPGNSNGALYPWIQRNTQVRVSVTAWSMPAGGVLTEYSGYRFWGEVSSWLPKSDPSGKDVWCEVTASGALRRSSQGNGKIGSALRRYYARLSGNLVPYGYWPAEDAKGAQVIASAITGVAGMAYTGTPSFGSDSNFGGSDPIPNVSSSSWHGQTSAASNPPGTGSLTEITPGTYTWTCPPGVTSVSVTATGAGGGGGAGGLNQGGGGGGGGEHAASTTVAVTSGVTYTYVVGAGGTAATATGAQGGNGADSHFTGDTVTVTAHGGKGGIGGDTSTGGSGGSGSTAPVHHNGGAGGPGSASSTFTNGSSVTGTSGAFGLGNVAGGSTSSAWTCPAGVTSVSVTAQGAGGGGGGGGFFGYGGAGGGGGGYSTGTITTTPGNTYTFFAGNGGSGGQGNTGSLTNCSGGPGGDSRVTGDSSTSVTGHSGGGGVATSGTHNQGGQGGAGSTSGGQGGAGNNTSNEGGGGGGGDSGQDGGSSGASSSGRTPGGGTGAGAGGGWGSTGSGGTTGGGTASGYGGGGGGGGSTDSGHGAGGGGGGPGFISWQWTITGAPAGGGGGGSGGTSAAGNAGQAGGTGGTAVTGGGAGGNAGATPQGAAPGGGGAGAGLASGSVSATPAGNGAAGQVTLSWSGGTVSPVAADIVRFLLDIQSSGGTDGTVLARVITFGTVERMDLVYHTGGNLELIGYNASGTVLFDSASQPAFAANGTPMMAEISLTANAGGTSATWSLSAIKPGAAAAIATFTGTVSGVSVGYVSDVYISPNSDVNFASAGQISAQTYADPLTTLATITGGYNGELAATRLSRLCSEEGLTFTLVGNASDTPQMGPQQDDTLLNVVQSCEEVDRGQVYEPADSLGLAYRTRVSMQAQSPALTLDYSLAQLAGVLEPLVDDQYTRNDVTVTRNNGSSATVVITSGPMSTADPPNGCGDYVYTQTVYCYSDTQLLPLATWIATVGTVQDDRYPVISVDMARTEVISLFGTIPALDVGDYIQVINPPSWLTSVPISQLAWGLTEHLNTYRWTLDWNAVPASPYNEGNPPVW